jgi:hypothetical protein
MATYTHSTPARYTHGSTNRVHSVKGARNTVFLRHLRKARTRSRPTSLLKVAKRIYSESFPSFGGSFRTEFQDDGLAEAAGGTADPDFDHIKKSTRVVDKSSNTIRSHT